MAGSGQRAVLQHAVSCEMRVFSYFECRAVQSVEGPIQLHMWPLRVACFKRTGATLKGPTGWPARLLPLHGWIQTSSSRATFKLTAVAR